MKLIAIDLDGTLLSRTGVITKANQEAIRRRQEQGDIVTICSRRSIHDIEELLKRSDLVCPILSGNGAIGFYENERIYRISELSPHSFKGGMKARQDAECQ